MTNARTKASLFNAMGLGPVWELKANETPQVQVPVPVPAIPAQGVHQELPSLKSLQSTVANCKKCSLCETRKQTVFADGIAHAPLMVVGEAPGIDEDAVGLPFVGRAGQLLDRMLAAISVSRANNVYIANVLKCHPPGNRNPESAEIAECSPYLVEQIKANDPKVLLLVGRFAIQTLLNSKKPVGELRGQVHRVTLDGLDIPAVVTYHPAYLLRRPEEKSKVWDDLLLLKQQGIV
jgi:uracil-DNA glycosylase family 4